MTKETKNIINKTIEKYRQLEQYGNEICGEVADILEKFIYEREKDEEENKSRRLY